jgi:hypothetical protein
VIDVEYEEVDEPDDADRRSREDAEAEQDLPPPEQSRWGKRG